LNQERFEEQLKVQAEYNFRQINDSASIGETMDIARHRRRRRGNSGPISYMFRRRAACPVLCVNTGTLSQRSAYGRSKVPGIIGGKWLLRGCPKCRGDLYYNIEPEGEYMHCLQCGYDSDA